MAQNTADGGESRVESSYVIRQRLGGSSFLGSWGCDGYSFITIFEFLFLQIPHLQVLMFFLCFISRFLGL